MHLDTNIRKRFTQRIGRLAGLLCLAATTVHAAEIRLRLVDPPPDGTVFFAVYDEANPFGDLREPAYSLAAALDGREVYSITNLPPGEYALMVYYDENSNGFLDKNFIGIPREPLGFSNNYKPKGPPSFTRAAFNLSEEDLQPLDIEFYRPLGKRGRLGIGPGVVMQSAPYRGYEGAVYQFIPAITYTGERLQWFGPRVQFGLVGSDRFRLAATGTYRIRPYEEDGSDYLDGMGDAEDLFMAGLSMQAELPGGLDLSLGAATDVEDWSGGHEVSMGCGKSFQLGILRLSPGIAVNWMDSAMAGIDYGVPTSKALPGRPAYLPEDAFSLALNTGLFVEITRSWLFVGNAGVEWLDSTASDSPIVDQNQVFSGYMAINYLF